MAISIRQLLTADSGERRDSIRRLVAVTGASIQHGAGADAAVLLDLSIYGCRLAAEGSAEQGERLLIRFEAGLPIAASVVWAEGGRIGCRFDEPIPGSLMRELIRALF